MILSGLLTFSLSLAALISDIPSANAFAPCTNPAIRKEWRDLTTAEKANWISAVKCLGNLPRAANFTANAGGRTSGAPPYNASGSYYDDMVFWHIDVNTQVHSTGLFFPWHRYYVQVYENTLKELCGLTTPSPYWDWSRDAKNVQISGIFTDVDPISGLGGWGNPSDDYQLTEGAFATEFAVSYPAYHRIRRQYTRKGPDPESDLIPIFQPAALRALINGFVGNFSAFQYSIEPDPHGKGHGVVGGDLAGKCPKSAGPSCGTGGPQWAANDPMFWLHHGNVDKIWFDWQMSSPQNTYAFAGGARQDPAIPTGGAPMLTLSSPMPSDGLGPTVTVGDVLSTTSGFLCYKYQ